MKSRIACVVAAAAAMGVGHSPGSCATPATNSGPADLRLAAYFRAGAAVLQQQCLSQITTAEAWLTHESEFRRQLAEMLGLDPMPTRSELNAVVTRRLEHDDIIVENLHFQSLPKLYITANLYRPKDLAKPAPTILYLCGHGPVITNGVSYGNKVQYQHHGIWFARHGYVCLVVDTVQLGEIQGVHHGTYRLGQWWWNARGYTPAGVEAWSGLRALDYLCTRPEVDTNRFGVTGRSGGGAYSWTVAALDSRVKVAAPVAGITDLQNQVVDGAVEGHCDCMFFVNTYRWDYPLLAALTAPRPLLLVNTDSDTIFPLDGVMRTDAYLRRLYEHRKASADFGLVIGPGPHKDTQNLQVPVFRWFNRHLKGEDPPIQAAALPLFTPQQLKVFDALPADAINTKIQQVFVPTATPPGMPSTPEEWERMRRGWLAALRAKCFAGWPQEELPLRIARAFTEGGYEAIDFESQPHVTLRLYLARKGPGRKPGKIVLAVGPGWSDPGTNRVRTAQGTNSPSPLAEALAAFAAGPRRGTDDESSAGATLRVALLPRGLGEDTWSGDARKQTQLRRRFMLLGQTLDGMRVWDIRRGIQVLRSMKELDGVPIDLEAEGAMGVNVLFASLFQAGVHQIDLWHLPKSLADGPDYLNVLKVLDLPAALALSAERCPTRLHVRDAAGWDYPALVAQTLHWPSDQFALDALPASEAR